MKNLILISIISFSFASDTNHFSSELHAMKQACDRKVSTACFEFGLLYEKGIGLEKNISKAASFYHKSCEYGYTEGCHAFKRVKEEE